MWQSGEVQRSWAPMSDCEQEQLQEYATGRSNSDFVVFFAFVGFFFIQYNLVFIILQTGY